MSEQCCVNPDYKKKKKPNFIQKLWSILIIIVISLFLIALAYVAWVFIIGSVIGFYVAWWYDIVEQNI